MVVAGGEGASRAATADLWIAIKTIRYSLPMCQVNKTDAQLGKLRFEPRKGVLPP